MCVIISCTARFPQTEAGSGINPRRGIPRRRKTPDILLPGRINGSPRKCFPASVSDGLATQPKCREAVRQGDTKGVKAVQIITDVWQICSALNSTHNEGDRLRALLFTTVRRQSSHLSQVKGNLVEQTKFDYAINVYNGSLKAERSIPLML